MNLTTQRQEQIVRYFRQRPEVVAVFLYGSQSEDAAGPLSDVDLGVLVNDAIAATQYLNLQLTYIKKVEEIVSTDLVADVKILNRSQPLTYLAGVIHDGVPLVVNDSQGLRRFTHRVSVLFPDFYPVLQRYYHAMHERLSGGTYATGR